MQKPLVEQAADEIINYIINENLDSGDKLPNEYQLATQLEVGRSTLREAVRTLTSRNILEVKQGAGTYVSENKGISEDPLGFIFVKDTLKLTRDLFELRYILEPEVTMLAARNHTEDQLNELEQVAIEIEESMQREDELHLNLDVQFHGIIAKMSRNIAMDHLIPIINQSISLYNNYYTSETSKRATVDSHREIVDSIRERDLFRAKHAMQLHIIKNQKQLATIEQWSAKIN
ncbi:MAG: FadR family transcriptional regulator [Saprospiraceae bacterium]|nr:FadR family transcriptional regulator [Saprospiraceae bacterium]